MSDHSAGTGPWLRPLTVVVAVVGLVLTAALAWATATVNGNNNHRLLQLEVRQAASVVAVSLNAVQSQLADALAVETDTGHPAAFKRFALNKITPEGSFVSLSLWEKNAKRVSLLAYAGSKPALATTGQAARFFYSLQPSPQLWVAKQLSGVVPYMGYAYMPVGDKHYVVYAESPLPSSHKFVVPKGSAFGDLNFALYLGNDQDKSQLLEASVPTPVVGPHAAALSPFGNTFITVVGTPKTPLSGALTEALPWVVLGVGIVISVVGAGILEYILRRRHLAENLAQENERLYLEQRSIAATLQHALLPVVPAFGALQVAARYIPGVASIDVGGDWYDVIDVSGERCFFVVGDVSGRGLPAATAMASLRYATRAYVAQGDDPATVLNRLGQLLDFERDGQFATVLVGQLDLREHKLTVASAGHFPPLIISNGSIHFVDIEVTPPVGVNGYRYPVARRVPVPEAGTLIAFTDGLVERRGETLDVGLDRLRASADQRDQPSGALDSLVDRIVDSLVPDGVNDDVVILGLQWQS